MTGPRTYRAVIWLPVYCGSTISWLTELGSWRTEAGVSAGPLAALGAAVVGGVVPAAGAFPAAVVGALGAAVVGAAGATVVAVAAVNVASGSAAGAPAAAA